MARRSKGIVIAGIVGALVCQVSHAWGPDGHHTVGALADKLIAGTNAESQVKAILGGLSLADAAVWADCAKGVDPKTFVYKGEGRFPECKGFESTAGEAEMSDFVQRNSSCVVKPGEEACNKQYHYTDVNVAQKKYKLGLVGTRDDDIVAAISAAVHFLKGDTVPSPFSFKDKHEALLVLSHYVGDVHQPLHVGTVYLSATGKRVNPDKSGFDPATFTIGGNALTVSGANLHSKWDAIPASLKETKITAAWITRARAVPATPGDMMTWSTSWATNTLGQAKSAYQGVTFGSRTGQHWPATLPSGYAARMTAIKKTQLTAGGAHLAALLEAIWP
jgi:hypothetical protein